MPTAMVLALAVAALLPLATSRPYYHGSTFASTTNFRSDIAITGSGIASCIEDDTTLIGQLSECLQEDDSFEDSFTRRNDNYFGVLDEDWRQLHLLHQGMLSDDSFLKEKLVLAFRTLLASFYQTNFTKWKISKIERHGKPEEYSTTNKTVYSKANNDGHTIVLGAERKVKATSSTPLVDVKLDSTRTITPMVGATPPTYTVEMVLDDVVSNDIVYEGAGSDPKGSVLHPPLNGDNKDAVLNTDGPYGVSDATIYTDSYESEGIDNTNTFDDEKVTTSEINSLSKDFRDLVDNRFTVWSTERFDSQVTQSDGPKNEIFFTTSDITVHEDSLMEPTGAPNKIINIEKGEGRGTDIDENELFPPPSAEAEENEVHASNLNPNADDVKMNITYSTSPADLITDAIPRDISNHPTLNNELKSNDIDVVTYDEQDIPATDDTMKQDVISRATTTLVVGYVKTPSDVYIEGKENESDYEETSTTPSHSQQENKDISVDVTGPIVPITYPAERKLVSIPYTTYNVETDKFETEHQEGNGKDFAIGVSSDPVRYTSSVDADISKTAQNEADGKAFDIGVSSDPVSYTLSSLDEDMSKTTKTEGDGKAIGESPGSVPYTTSSVDADISNTTQKDSDGKAFDIGESSGPVPYTTSSVDAAISNTTQKDSDGKAFDIGESSGPVPYTASSVYKDIPKTSQNDYEGKAIVVSSGPVPYTESSVYSDISNTTEKGGDRKAIGVSSDPLVSLDLPQETKDNSVDMYVILNQTTPSTHTNPISDSDTDFNKLDSGISKDNSSERNQPIISNTDLTSEKEITLATETNGNLHHDDKVRFDQISTQPSENQYTDLFNKTEGNSNSNYDLSANKENDLRYLNSSQLSTPYLQKGTTPLPPSGLGHGNTNSVYQTDKSLIYTTSNDLLSPEATKSPRDSIDLTIPEIPIEITHNVDKDIFPSSGATEGIKEFTIITSEEPELRGQTEQKTPIIQSIPLEGISPPTLQPESKNYGFSNESEDGKYEYTSSIPDSSLHPAPDPVEQFPQSKDDVTYTILTTKSFKNPSTLTLDNDRGITESIGFEEHITKESILPITTINTTWDFNRKNRTESKVNLRSFSIPLPEAPKAKQGKVIVNQLRVFSPSNNHILITQPMYKYDCISQNDCVRVGNSLILKQRRNPTVNLDKDGEDDLQLSALDKDSILWWHKMRALKKKSR